MSHEGEVISGFPSPVWAGMTGEPSLLGEDGGTLTPEQSNNK